ncbi:MAG: hypothetical protein HUJ56_06430 [Erysipelotrichaceae bacterium]|nr:hypothetical protein [Erysipelotrichaceae bacterium]
MIAVPYVEIITNKTGLIEAGMASITSPNGKEVEVFGLFGIFNNRVQKELKKYIDKEGEKKIICTYDKLPYLMNYLDSSLFRLLVDEYQLLLKAYSYRRKAIEGVFDNFRAFKSYCFMSATPIAPDFQPSQLDGIPVVEAEWDDVERLKVVLQSTNNPYTLMANIINKYKTNGYLDVNGIRSYEAFIFINSVTDIANILQHCDLSPEDARVICSDNEDNLKKLPSGFTISNSRSESKMFTFITSKSFEGADYFSDTGVSFVVSNSRNTNTLLDISTDIYQIAGRIRNESNPFKNSIVHIFNTTGKRCLDNIGITYEEMKEKVFKEMNGMKQLIDFANSNDSARMAAGKVLNDDYVIEDSDGKYKINDTLMKLELFTFRIEHEIYTKGIAIRKAYKDSGSITIVNDYEKIKDSIATASKKISFKEAYLMYSDIMTKPHTEDEVKNLISQQPLIEEAYILLGDDKVRSLRYVKKAIEKELQALDTSKNNNTKIAKILNLSIGFHPSSKLKKEIQNAYNLLGIDAKAKATDITKWFEAEQTSKRVDGKVTKGFQIYKNRYVFNNLKNEAV